MSVIHKLFSEIVDYAGLFPPAKLPLDEVVANFANYLGSDEAWMLARLIIPAGRLNELENQQPFLDSDRKWMISSLVPAVDAPDSAFDKAMSAIAAFNHQFDGKAVVDTVEIKAQTLSIVHKTIEQMPTSLNAFLEIPHQEDPYECIAAIASAANNIFAKIRTGGVTTDLIPPPAEVARFIACCGKTNAGFKATAGLHHPLRAEYRLTYDADAQLGTMFGFVNVFVAACFAFDGNNDVDFLERILVADDPATFEFSDQGISFESQSVSSDQIEQIRKTKAISFGSCSFTEPSSELFELGWIQATA